MIFPAHRSLVPWVFLSTLLKMIWLSPSGGCFRHFALSTQIRDGKRDLSPALKAPESLSGYFVLENDPYSEIHDPYLKNHWTPQTWTNFCSENLHRKRSASSFTSMSLSFGLWDGLHQIWRDPAFGNPCEVQEAESGSLSISSTADEDLAAPLQCCSPGNVEKVTPHLSPSLLLFVSSVLSCLFIWLSFYLISTARLGCSVGCGRGKSLWWHSQRDLRAASGKGRVRQHSSWMSDNTH